VDAVLDGIDSIASGGGGAVSALIEGALVKALPMVIGFMASLLGLGGISEKIRGILQKVQEPVGKVIDKVIGTIVKIGKGLLRGLRRGGARVAGAVGGAWRAVLGKLGDKKPVTMKGNSHQVWVAKRGGTFQVMMASRTDTMLRKIGVALASKKVKSKPQLVSELSAARNEAKRLQDDVFTYDHAAPDQKKAREAEAQLTALTDAMLGHLHAIGQELDIDELKGTRWTLDGEELIPEAAGDVRNIFYGGSGKYRSALPNPGKPFLCPGWPAHKDITKQKPHMAPSNQWSVDHKDSVALHWLATGRKKDQTERDTYYKDPTKLQGMCKSCNSSKSSRDPITLVKEVFTPRVEIPDFKGPDGNE
jgi:hypothetical protein